MSKHIDAYRVEMSKLDKSALVNILTGIYAALGPVMSADGKLLPGMSFQKVDVEGKKVNDYGKPKNFVFRTSAHSPTSRNAGETSALAVALVAARIIPNEFCGFNFNSYEAPRDFARAHGLDEATISRVVRETAARSIPENAVSPAEQMKRGPIAVAEGVSI